MKSLCIKTNNSNLLQYLLNELKHFELPDIFFSLRKFKHYNNIIIHYTGNNNSLFIDKISHLLSIMIIDELEENILIFLLSQNYFYFDSNERKEIINLSFDIMSEDFYKTFDKKLNLVYTNLVEYIDKNKSLFLGGFIHFRLKNYFNFLDDILSRSVNNYIIQKEYLEFVSLLRLYIESQSSNCNVVHLLYSNSESILLDENKEIINIYNFNLNAKYLSDINFSVNDYTLNTLLNLLPKKIFIHLVDSNIDEFINTLQSIFENRVTLCLDCDICNLYKNITNTTKNPSAN